MEPGCRIEMLGGLRVRVGGRTIERFRTKKTATLLALLALHPGRIFPRDEAIEIVWPDGSEESGRNSLRIALSSLRKSLGETGDSNLLHSDRGSISLSEEIVATDVRDFERSAKSGSKLGQAVSLYRGELLPGLHSEWIISERERLADLYLGALQQLARSHLENNDYERAIDLVHQAIRADPFAEESYRIGIRAQLGLGRLAAAHEVYRSLELTLRDELAIEPSKETKALLANTSRPRIAPAEWESSEAGKGIEPPTSRFFGRDDELSKLSGLLSGGRLVTITGPGGVGKTRLALELTASGRLEEVERSWFVPLAQVDNASEMLAAVAATVSTDASETDIWERMGGPLLKAASLLVLDNLEQAGDSAREVVLQLLSHFPRIRILATSRIPVDVEGEQILCLGPLPIPPEGPSSVASLLQSPAVQLFVDRVRMVRPQFRVDAEETREIAKLMGLLEGLPLAVELAAARARILSVREMLGYASERFSLLHDPRSEEGSRHRSLRAALDWGFSLLGAEERELLTGLSVFRSGWTLEAAQEVCGGVCVLDGLDALIRDSLVGSEERNGVNRFRMLETIREYAEEKLGNERKEDVGESHANYYLRFVQRATPHLEGAEQGYWINGLEADFANIRAAQNWFHEHGRTDNLHALLASLWPYLSRVCSLADCRSMLEPVIDDESFRVQGPTGLQILEGASKLAEMHCDFDQATVYAERGLHESRRLLEPAFEAEFLGELGILAKRRANLPEADRLWSEAYRVATVCGATAVAARCLTSLATIARLSEDVPRARRLFGEALAAYELTGDPHKIAVALQNLGLLACDEGEYEESMDYLKRGLQIRYEISDTKGIAFSLGALGQTFLAAGRFEEGCSYYAEGLDLCLRLDNRTGLEHCLWDLTHGFVKHGFYEFGARMLGALERVYAETGIELQPYELEDWQRTLVLLKESLGDPAVVRLMGGGRSLSLDAAARELRSQLAEMAEATAP